MKFISATLICLILSACIEASQNVSSSFFEGVPRQSTKQINVIIESNKSVCYAAWGEQKCLVISLENGQKETLTEGIYGYKHIDGKARSAILERIEFDLSKPELLPQDISTVQYRLIELR